MGMSTSGQCSLSGINVAKNSNSARVMASPPRLRPWPRSRRHCLLAATNTETSSPRTSTRRWPAVRPPRCSAAPRRRPTKGGGVPLLMERDREKLKDKYKQKRCSLCNAQICEQAFNFFNKFTQCKSMNEYRFRLYFVYLIPLSHFWISAACGENKNFVLPPLLKFWLKKYDFSSTSHLLRIFQPKFQEG